jgi:GR25 family glycosyltransferase involved in LPS biosynthesis
MSYKIIVINLKHREDRKNNILKLLNNNGIVNDNNNLNNKYTVDFFEAINGKNIELSLEIKNIFSGNDFSARKGFIGCALSHYNIWLQLIEDNENDFYIIFEDDITVCDNFEYYLNQAINRVINSINTLDINSINTLDINTLDINTLDILFIGFTKSLNMIDYDTWSVDNNIDFIKFTQELYSIGGLFGYIITKNGANKIINSIEKTGVKHGIDYYIKINDNILNMELCKPSIVYTGWCDSFNSIVDSDIQKDYDCFNLDNIFDYHNYQFIKGLDQSNNDIEFIGNNMEKLILRTNQLDYLSDGFNTLGFIKTNINYNTLSESKWFGNNDGIYIKLNKKYRIKVKIIDETGNDNDCNNLLNSLVEMNKTFISKNLIINFDSNSYSDLNITLNIDFIDEKYNIYPNWNINLSENILKENLKEKILIYDSTKKYNTDFFKYLNDTIMQNNDNIELNNKVNNLFSYKYTLIGNNLWKGILSECICFYYGDLNIINNIDHNCLVKINLDDYEASYKIIKDSIMNNLWENRIDCIKREKYRILHYYSFFPIIERRITKNYIDNDIKFLNKILNINKIKIIILNGTSNSISNGTSNGTSNNINYKIVPFILTMKDFGFNIDIDIKNMLSFDNIYSDLNNNNSDNDNSYIFIHDKWILNNSYINFINHILYLPNNYDFCYINNNSNNKIINQVNSLYYEVKKYYFKCNDPYIISKNGIKKIINYNLNKKNKIQLYEFDYNLLYNIDNFNIYSNKYKLFSLSK